MRKLILFFLLIPSLSSFAQRLSGSLIDEQSHPLSFVNVANAKALVGTYSDEDGRFSIDVSDLKETDEVIFSHLGYVEIKMNVAQLSKVTEPIQMKPKNYSLREVVVGTGGAKDLLMDALSHIKDNYPAEFTNNHILFKDYSAISGEKNHYYNFDFNMYIPSYLAKDSPRIYTVDNKHEMYEKKGALFHVAIQPTQILKLMYPERLFDPKMMAKNDFQMVSTSTTIDGEEYDVIEFDRKPQKGDHSITAKGHVYINKNDKGIRFIEFHVYNLEPSRFMLVAKMDTLNINAKIAFIKIDGKYMLDYIQQNTYASGKFIGKHQNLVFSTTARVVDRQAHLKMNQIVMKAEVDDIFLNEKPKDTKEMKSAPDMR
jgi:hypothetical protein